MDLSNYSNDELRTMLMMVKAVSFAGSYGSRPNGEESLKKLFEERQNITTELKRREKLFGNLKRRENV